MALRALSGTISLHDDHPLNLEKASAVGLRSVAWIVFVRKRIESRGLSGKDVRLHLYFRFLPLS
jgi:hypothetical protein